MCEAVTNCFTAIRFCQPISYIWYHTSFLIRMPVYSYYVCVLHINNRSFYVFIAVDVSAQPQCLCRFFNPIEIRELGARPAEKWINHPKVVSREQPRIWTWGIWRHWPWHYTARAENTKYIKMKTFLYPDSISTSYISAETLKRQFFNTNFATKSSFPTEAKNNWWRRSWRP